MSYNLYQTKGIVLKSEPSKEANKFFYILTADLGMIRATAQSVRGVKSKLRYSLQDFSYSDISLVYGKGGWRIINTIADFNIYFLFRDEKYKLYAVLNILNLVKRLVVGEEKNEELFKIVFVLIEFLDKNDLSRNEIENIEVVTVMRVLNNLGYFDKKGLNEDFFCLDQTKKELLNNFDILKKGIVLDINKALKETQLNYSYPKTN